MDNSSSGAFQFSNLVQGRVETALEVVITCLELYYITVYCLGVKYLSHF